MIMMIKTISVIALFFASIVMPGSQFYLWQTGPLISFDVAPGPNQSVLIEWKIKHSIETPRFILERSGDQKKWKRIATMPAQLSPLYSFKDDQTGDGLNYYRLSLAGAENDLIFSGVKWVQVNKSGALYIWPNPAKDILYIKTPFIKGRINIIDGGGKLLFNVVITSSITKIPTDRMSKGIYFIHVMHAGNIMVEKFMKE